MKNCIIACVLLIDHGGILARKETGRFPGGPLLQEVYWAPDRLFNLDVVIFRWILTSKIGTKLLSSDAFTRLKLCQKCVCGQAPPQTSLEELIPLPRPHSQIWEMVGRKGWKRGGKGRKGEGPLKFYPRLPLIEQVLPCYSALIFERKHLLADTATA